MNVGKLKEVLENYDDNVEIVASWEGQHIGFSTEDIEMIEGRLEIWVDNFNEYSEENEKHS